MRCYTRVGVMTCNFAMQGLILCRVDLLYKVECYEVCVCYTRGGVMTCAFIIQRLRL